MAHRSARMLALTGTPIACVVALVHVTSACIARNHHSTLASTAVMTSTLGRGLRPHKILPFALSDVGCTYDCMQRCKMSILQGFTAALTVSGKRFWITCASRQLPLHSSGVCCKGGDSLREKAVLWPQLQWHQWRGEVSSMLASRLPRCENIEMVFAIMWRPL